MTSIWSVTAADKAADAKLISLKNGKKFLYLYAGAEDGDGYVCGIYRYVSGK